MLLGLAALAALRRYYVPSRGCLRCTSVRTTGGRSRIKLRDGTEFVDVMVNRLRNSFELEDHGRVQLKRIRSMSIYQEGGKDEDEPRREPITPRPART